MAKRKKGTDSPQATFAETMHLIGYRFSLAKAFDDFLTMAIAACTQNPATGKSHYEEEYLEAIAYYKDSELRHEFPKAFAQLVMEMEERMGSGKGNDVLGDFFEQNVSNGRNGQFFTPYPICEFMASAVAAKGAGSEAAEREEPLRMLDPACGSGRMLVAARKVNGGNNSYYGIDIDRVCVKMAALNLFLNGMWGSEVMCADALMPQDFVVSYRISFLPFGIFKIVEKEKSVLWHMHLNSFARKDNDPPEEAGPNAKSPTYRAPDGTSTQLTLF
ncbi:N-6 DNA methylase [Parasediminibacterium sp. JCM 36343]|uniref:N-6 DNA methylase n=1 Tax=Parasediminibacterium sp. JCM 36343 TaxID=3374279 RepID=UPI003978CAE8